MIKITREDLDVFFKLSNIFARKDIERLKPETNAEVNRIIADNNNIVLDLIADKFDDSKMTSKEQKTLDEITATADALAAKAMISGSIQS